jgi:membrane protease YdiL (CAAX protease family)
VLLFLAIFGAVAVTATLLVAPMAATGTVAGMMAGSMIALMGALLAGAIAIRRLDRRPVRAIGIPFGRAALRDAAAGLLIGIASIAIAALFLRSVGTLRYTVEAGDASGWLRAVAHGLVFFAAGAAAEEAMFRGYPFQVIARAAGPVAATIGVSAAFAVAHVANPNVSLLALANIFLAGVMLSAAYLRTRSLWLAFGVHLGWNWGMASLLDLPVSGLDFMETPRYEPLLAGPAWWTGGAFGPEGGLAATVGFMIALIAVLKWPGLDETTEMRALRPLVDRA